MKRLWIVLALVIAGCSSASSEPTPTPTITPEPIPTDTPSPPATNTPTAEPTETPRLNDLQLSMEEVAAESLTLSDDTIDLQTSMTESGMCEVDCAGTIYTTASDSMDITIFMVGFEDNLGAQGLVETLSQGSLAGGATLVEGLRDEAGLESLPADAVVVYQDLSWSLAASQGTVFIGVDLVFNIHVGAPTPQEDIFAFGLIVSRLGALQAARLVEAGF